MGADFVSEIGTGEELGQEAGDRVSWGMAFDAKPHDLSLFSRTHMVERGKN